MDNLEINTVVVYRLDAELEDFKQRVIDYYDSVYFLEHGEAFSCKRKDGHPLFDRDYMTKVLYVPLKMQHSMDVSNIAGLRIHEVKWLTTDLSLKDLQCIESWRVASRR